MKFWDKFKLQTYNIGIIYKNAREIIANGVGAGEIIWLRHNYKDRFFADPFLWRIDESHYYILVEEYLFWERKGKITMLTVDRNTFTLLDRDVLIEENVHLSFPFCELNGNTIIPESSRGGKTYTYGVSNEQVTKTVVVPEGLVDAVFYTDKNGEKWIFASKKERPLEDLYLYKNDGKNYLSICDGKPILSSLSQSRSAGRLFECDGKLYRPVQDNCDRYGHQTKLMHIIKFNENEYIAEEACTINSYKNPPYDETLHTFNMYDGYAIVDGSKDVMRFPMKLFYMKCPFIFNSKR